MISRDRRKLYNEVQSQLERLTNNQLSIVSSMARALLVPVEFSIGERTDFVDSAFSETISNLLTLHHALHEEPLNKKSFEYLFKQCLTAAGYDARLNPKPGDSSWDVDGAGLRWSLKTEAAQGISANSIKIEKFMEARWVRDAITPADCAEAIRTLLPRHMQHYDRILVLRAFSVGVGFLYSLDEVPAQLLLDNFAQVRAEDVAKRGRAISYGVDFFHQESRNRIFRILLDSSVEKIRLWYGAPYAINHGRWTIRVADVQDIQQESMES